MDPSTAADVARLRMVRHQLARQGIVDRRVLDAMSRVPRERFVNVAEPAEAYADRAQAISCGQTISQPVIVALMTQALGLRGSETVLEIGTGSGYQTAILAELAARVVSIERHAALSEKAGQVLADLGYANVELHVDDGTRGWPAAAPYAGILVAAATGQCPPALLAQLADGGRLIIPLGGPTAQVLECIERHGERFRTTHLTGCRFVPLIAGDAPPGDAAHEDDDHLASEGAG